MRCNKHGTTIIEGICNHCEYTKPISKMIKKTKKNEGQ